MVSFNFKYNSIFQIFFCILPIALIFSTAISTIIVSILSIIGLIYFIKIKNINVNISYIIYFFIIWNCILILSSLLSDDIINSFESSLFYFRFIFFSFFIYIFFNGSSLSKKYFSYCFLLTLVLLLCDSMLQYFTGTNIFGNASPSDRQITSFFETKRVLGSYLSRLSPLILFISVIYYKKNNILFYFSISIYLLSFFGIIISGERVSFLYYVIFFIFTLFILNIRIKYKLFTIFFLIFFILFNFSLNEKLSERFVDVTLKQYTQDNSLTLKNSPYYNFWITSYILFKDNYYTGIGPKNFRIKCIDIDIENGCSTHPHNIYVQLFSETGLIGSIPFIFIYIYFLHNLFKLMLKKNKKKNEIINYFSLLAILLNFFPFLPSGNFFGSWLSIFFYLPIGLYFYSLNNSEKI